MNAPFSRRRFLASSAAASVSLLGSGRARAASPNGKLRVLCVGVVGTIGGGKANTCSILEAFGMVEAISGRKMQYQYSEQHREGDHICYYSDLRKMRSHYPGWDISISLQECLQQMVAAWQKRD